MLCFRVIYLNADRLEGLYKKKKILGEKDEKRKKKNEKKKGKVFTENTLGVCVKVSGPWVGVK